MKYKKIVCLSLMCIGLSSCSNKNTSRLKNNFHSLKVFDNKIYEFDNETIALGEDNQSIRNYQIINHSIDKRQSILEEKLLKLKLVEHVSVQIDGNKAIVTLIEENVVIDKQAIKKAVLEEDDYLELVSIILK